MLGLACWKGWDAVAAKNYAQVSDVKIHRDALDPECVTVSYLAQTSGTVALRRAKKDDPSGPGTEMLDNVRNEDVGSRRSVRWQLNDLKAGDVIQVRGQEGWSPVTADSTVPGVAVPAEVAATDAAPELAAEASPGLYSRRTQAERAQWIGNYGGSAISEKAVTDGLDWLARHQAADGSWSNRCLGSGAESRCEKASACTDAGGTFEMAHSGLALLAFQAGGHYYFNGAKYSELVRKGLDWIVDHQKNDGELVGSAGPNHHDHMYEHGIATFALGDACAAAAALQQPPNSRYMQGLRKAVEYIYQNQHEDGGWRYNEHVRQPSDTSVTGWQVLALKSAREAGIPLNEACLAKVRDYFQARETGENGRTGYVNDRKVQTEATTGVGMLAKQFLFHEPEAPLVKSAAAYLAGVAAKTWPKDAPAAARDYYMWYNCTLAMFQAGGEAWKQWNDCVRDTIIKLQRLEGCERGSWDPSDRWGDRGGRIYSTALAILTLEVYYRYALDKDPNQDVFELNVTTRGAPATGAPATGAPATTIPKAASDTVLVGPGDQEKSAAKKKANRKKKGKGRGNKAKKSAAEAAAEEDQQPSFFSRKPQDK